MDRQSERTVTVLIAGAGPSGLAAAAELAWHGIDCLVIEPRGDVSTTRPRAKTTSARTMEHLRRWGVAGTIRAAAPLAVEWSQRVTFCWSLQEGPITDFDGAFGLAVGRSELMAEAGQQVAQPVLERVLREHLGEAPAIEFRYGHRVTGLRQDADGVTVTVTGPDGPYLLQPRYVLGCDGPGSVVREQIGAHYHGRTDPRPCFNVVIRAPGLQTSLAPAVQYWVVGGRVPGVIGRLDLDGTWWAIFPGVTAEHGHAHLPDLLAGLAGTRFDYTLLAADPWAARMALADTFCQGRVFLAGDSAHLNPPWGGHGYNTCVGDSVNIGWKIAAVEHGWAGPRLLDSYQAERRGVAEATIASAEFNLASLAGDLVPDAATIQRLKRAEFYSLGLVLGYSYAGSPVIQPTDAPVVPADTTVYTPSAEPGSRLPHCWYPDGSSLYDHLSTGLTLLGPLAAAPGGTAALASRARRADIPLKLLEPPAGYPWETRFLLVRPDQHIAWRAPDPAEIDLSLVTGRPPTIAPATAPAGARSRA